MSEDATGRTPARGRGRLSPTGSTGPLWAGIVVVAALDAAAVAAVPLVVGRTVNGLVAQSARTAVLAVGLLLVCQTVSSITGGMRVRLASWLAQRQLATLRRRLVDQLFALDLDFFARSPAGGVVSRLTSDLDNRQQLVEGAIPVLIRGFFIVTLLVGVLATQSLTLTAALTLPLLPLAAALVWYRRQAFQAELAVRRRTSAASEILAETSAGAAALQRPRAAAWRAVAHEQATSALFDAKRRSARVAALYQPVVELLQPAAVAAVLVLGGAAVTSGDAEVGLVVAFVLAASRVFEPIQQAAELSTIVQAGRASRATVNQFLDQRPLIADVPDAQPLRATAGGLELRDVVFRYPGTATTALGPLSLRVEAGQRIAVLGETGAGKTTLARLLCRAYDPTAGTVLVDGQDLAGAQARTVRSAIALVPQEGFLFDATVLDNIRMAKPAATEETVRDACATLGILDRLEALPQGLHTRVTDHGRSLSSGQRQLVALARALVTDPAVLILDEATSHLDPVAEIAVENAMWTLLHGRTSVVIAHRLRATVHADLVVVLEHGRVMEAGRPADLARSGGLYARWLDREPHTRADVLDEAAEPQSASAGSTAQLLPMPSRGA